MWCDAASSKNCLLLFVFRWNTDHSLSWVANINLVALYPSRIVVRYNEDDDRSNETIARLSRLSVDYKPPSVALDRKQSSNEDGSVEFQSKELTAENYVARMHEVLYKEEEARSKAMSKYEQTAAIPRFCDGRLQHSHDLHTFTVSHYWTIFLLCSLSRKAELSPLCHGSS